MPTEENDDEYEHLGRFRIQCLKCFENIPVSRIQNVLKFVK